MSVHTSSKLKYHNSSSSKGYDTISYLNQRTESPGANPSNDNPSSLSIAINKMSEAIKTQRQDVQIFQENCNTLKHQMVLLRDATTHCAEKLGQINTKPIRAKSLRLAALMDSVAQ